MAWIKFDAARIKRLKKFHDFRKAMQWSVVEALGFLGSFWGESIEVCESGDVTGWTPEYLSEITGLKDSLGERVWEALGANGWLTSLGGKTLIHDWLDTAGPYLVKRYGGGENTAGREHLARIWALHGLTYGKATGKRPESDAEATIDKTRSDKTRTEEQTKPAGAGVVASAPPANGPGNGPGATVKAPDDGFEAWWAVWPHKTAKAAAAKAWRKLKPDAALQAALGRAVAAQVSWRAARAAAGAFTPAWANPATWLNGRRWEDELTVAPAVTGAVTPDGPPTGAPYKPATPVQRVVCLYKIVKGFAMEDAAWDAAQWAGAAKDAARLLAAFDGDDRAAVPWLEQYAAAKTAAAKTDWALRWAADDAWNTKAARAAGAAPERPGAPARPSSRGRLGADALVPAGDLTGPFLPAEDHFAHEETN